MVSDLRDDFSKGIHLSNNDFKLVKELVDWTGEGCACGSLISALLGEFQKAIQHHEKHQKNYYVIHGW